MQANNAKGQKNNRFRKVLDVSHWIRVRVPRD